MGANLSLHRDHGVAKEVGGEIGKAEQLRTAKEPGLEQGGGRLGASSELSQPSPSLGNISETLGLVHLFFPACPPRSLTVVYGICILTFLSPYLEHLSDP